MLITVAAPEVQDEAIQSLAVIVGLNTFAKCLDIGAYRVDRRDVGSNSKNHLSHAACVTISRWVTHRPAGERRRRAHCEVTSVQWPSCAICQDQRLTKRRKSGGSEAAVNCVFDRFADDCCCDTVIMGLVESRRGGRGRGSTVTVVRCSFSLARWHGKLKKASRQRR